MKYLRLLFLVGIGFLIGNQSLFAYPQQKPDKEQVAQQVKEAVEKRVFTIEVDRANPMSGRSVNLNSSYTLELKGDSAISYLPYYGRAYTAPYGGSDGVKFEEPVNDFELEFTKKGDAKIRFKVKSEDDSYTFNIDMFKNGNAVINVTPVNKQGIVYYGEMVLPVD